MTIVRLPVHARTPGTLAGLAREVDSRRYVCPPALARVLDQLLADDCGLRVVSLTGDGGTGKSAALRACARRAEHAGLEVASLDARETAPDRLVAALDDLTALARPTTVLIDNAEHLDAGLRALGPAVGRLPGETRLVLAGRRLPAAWLPAELEHLATGLRLSTLPEAPAEEMLLAYGVDDAEARHVILRWAGALPLALVLGAAAWMRSVDVAELARALPEVTNDELLERLVGPAAGVLGESLVDVLAVTGGLDPPLLRAVLADTADTAGTGDTAGGLDRAVEDQWQRLRTCSLVEPVGERLVLQPRLAALVARRARRTDPERVAQIVMRAAEHLRQRATAGESAALVRLAALVREPVVRAGLAPPVSAQLYADRIRSSDLGALRDAAEVRRPGLGALIAPWLELRGVVHVVRTVDGTAVAAVAALPLAHLGRLPAGCHALVDGVGVVAARHGSDRGVLTAFQFLLPGAGAHAAEVMRVRNAVALQRCGVANPRSDLVLQFDTDPREDEVLRAYGYQQVPTFASAVGPDVGAWRADLGPDGLAGMLYATVAAEQGRHGATEPVSGTALVEALHRFHDDRALAALVGDGVGDGDGVGAAERIRARVRRAITERLAGEPVLLELVQRRYLEPGGTHESTMRATYASRATYFRRLRRARDLLGGLDAP